MCEFLYMNIPIIDQSFWRDEAFSVLLSIKSIPEMINLTARDASPPLYYIVLHYWMQLFGDGERSVRMLSFVFHVLATGVGFFLAKHFVKKRFPALLISVAIFLNPFLLQFAFEARAYSLLTFLVITGTYFFVRGQFLLAGLALGFSIVTHNYGVLYTLALGSTFLWSGVKRHWRNMLIFSMFPLLLICLWGSVLATQLSMVSKEFWIPPVNNSLVKTSLEKFIGGDIYYKRRDLLFMMTLVVLFFATPYFFAQKTDKEKRDLLIVASMAFIPFILAYIISVYNSPIFFERYLIGLVPLAIILVGTALYFQLHAGKQIKYLTLGVIFFYFLTLYKAGQQVIDLSPKPPLNWAVSQVVAQAHPGDILLPEDKLNFLEMKLYLQKQGSNLPLYVYTEDGTIPFYIGGVLYEPHEVVTSTPSAKRIWYIKPDSSIRLVHPGSIRP